jgi:hypothetical protein
MSQTVTLYPTADAHVDALNPTTNYGAADYLLVDDNNRAFIRYGLSGVVPAGNIVLSAKLRIRSFYAGMAGLNIQRCTNLAWNEETLTYNNAPNSEVVADRDILYFDHYGPQGYIEYDVTKFVADALAAGGIGWRIKTAIAGGYNNFSWISRKDYTANGCTQLVVTYAPLGTVAAYIDVPVALDGYMVGTYVGELLNLEHLAYSVALSPANLPMSNSSSSGREIQQPRTDFITSNAALNALLPTGITVADITITKREYRVFCNQAWTASTGGLPARCLIDLMYSPTGALGTGIEIYYPSYPTRGPDWDFIGCSVVAYNIEADFNGTGWKTYTLPSHNPNGVTNVGFRPGTGVTDPSLAKLSGASNTDENAPVIRFYFEYIVKAKPRSYATIIG